MFRVVDEYQPDLVLISAGFDTWKADPLGGMQVSEAGYDALFALFAEFASKHCEGRMVCVLEGGYDPPGLISGVRAALTSMTTSKIARPLRKVLERFSF